VNLLFKVNFVKKGELGGRKMNLFAGLITAKRLMKLVLGYACTGEGEWNGEGVKENRMVKEDGVYWTLILCFFGFYLDDIDTL